MPHVINGIGTWYSGKRNVVTRKGACGLCGNWGDLRSYDTTLFFVVIFIPIIPLKRLHVVDDCPKCRRHRVMKQAEWDALRNEGIRKALEGVQAKPGDRDVAIDAIGTAVGLRDPEAFLGLSAIIEETSASDPIALAALAEGYEYFGHYPAAEQAMRRSLEISEDRGVRQALAVYLLQHGGVDEGVAMLEGPLRENNDRRRPALQLAVEAYQAEGRHTEALSLMDRIEAEFPGVSKDKRFTKARKTSRRLEKSGKRVPIAYMNPKAPATTRDGSLLARIPWLIGPALAVIGLAIYLTSAVWIGGHRTVHVINGLNRPVEAIIGPVRTSLRPYGYRAVEIPEGVHTVHLGAPGSHAVDQTIRVETSFWTRPFTSPVFVVNPDTAAVLEWEQVDYTAQGSSTKPGPAQTRLHTGSVLHRFDDIDYVFQDFPQVIQMPSKTSRVTKRRIDVLRTGGTHDSLRAVAEVNGPEAALAFCRAGLMADPTDAGFADGMMALAEPAEGIATLKPLLEDKPLSIEVHRAYQTLAERITPPIDVATEYRARLAAAPNDPVLKYLLARISPDLSERRRLLSDAAKDPLAGRYAATSLAFDAMACGDFGGALEAIDRTPKGIANAVRLSMMRRDALHALGRFGEILADPELAAAPESQDFATFAERAYYVCMKDGRAAADALVDQLLSAYRNAGQERDAVEGKKAFDALLAYVGGDAKPLAAHAKSGDPSLADLLAAGDLEAIKDDMPALQGSAGGTSHMLVAIAALAKGNEKLAATHRTAARKALAGQGVEERRLAAWLEGTTPPSVEDIRTMAMATSEKRIALALLGQTYPAIRAECFALARRLNFDRRPPHLLVASVVGEDQAAGIGAGPTPPTP